MKKGIILTGIQLSDKDKELLTNTNIFKIALNHHAEELKPDIRIISDYILKQMFCNFEQKIISIRERYICHSDRAIYPNLEFKGATMISAIEWLINEGYTDILIVGDNSVHGQEFIDLVNKEVNKLKDKANLFQFSKGKFNIATKEIEEFLEK